MLDYLIAAEHHADGNSGNSQYTSWSRSKEIAGLHAEKDGPREVLLSAPFGAPASKDQWSWDFLDEIYHEQEVLLKRPRHGLGAYIP